MRRRFLNAVRLVDQIFSHIFLKFCKERKALITFLFHGIFRNKNEINSSVVHPQQEITTGHFRQFIEYFLEQGYSFISPDDILHGFENDKRYILITFDDGYFASSFSLPVLKEYRVPAVFFISANHIQYNKCFWWDVLYRERIKRGFLQEDIYSEQEHLKLKTHIEIEEYLSDLFGQEAFKPISDIDRPFSPNELRNFSKERYVFLGNHTNDHAILTNYSSEAIRGQIVNSQAAICGIAGISPVIISYPNGAYSQEVVGIAKEAGLKLGVGTVPKKNYLPLYTQDDNLMHLGRFTLWGNDRLVGQCKAVRSEIGLYYRFRNMFKGELLRS